MRGNEEGAWKGTYMVLSKAKIGPKTATAGGWSREESEGE